MWKDLLIVYGAYVLAAGSPGPSNMAIMGTAMREGRKPAAAMAAGVVTMSFTWGLIAVTGLAALLVRFAQLLMIIKIVGGLYLLWLAYKSAKAAAQATSDIPDATNDDPSLSAMYRRGILMHVGNPKAILAWIALISLGAGFTVSAERLALTFGGCVILGAIIFFGYALLFSTPIMVRSYARARRWVEALLAVVLAAAGLQLLFSY